MASYRIPIHGLQEERNPSTSVKRTLNSPKNCDLYPRMESEVSIFTTNGMQLEYRIVGSGTETILAFHGFGQSIDDFNPFYGLIKPHQRLVSIRLFQHGNSQFPEQRIPHQPLQKLEFALVIQEFINFLQVSEFYLLGYSLGGKVCLNLLESIPRNIKGVLLLAPDGFKNNRIYSFTSKTAVGRSIYRYILNNPNPLFNLSKVLNSTGIINDGLHRFVMHHMRDYDQRKLVYDTWLIYRDFEINQRALQEILAQSSIPFNALFGKFDRIIRPEIALDFFEDDLAKSMHILNSGHLILNPSTKKFIQENGLWLGE